jgi:hypothetical protein
MVGAEREREREREKKKKKKKGEGRRRGRGEGEGDRNKLYATKTHTPGTYSSNQGPPPKISIPSQ